MVKRKNRSKHNRAKKSKTSQKTHEKHISHKEHEDTKKELVNPKEVKQEKLSQEEIVKKETKEKESENKKTDASKEKKVKHTSTNYPTSIKRISTGLSKFDSLIQGGFEKTSSNLLIGGSGTGKTIFGIQYLLEGAKKGEACLFISFEEKKENFYSYMHQIGFNLEELEKKKKFFFLEYTPGKVKKMLDEGGGEIESIVVGNKVTRIVIDDASTFTNMFEREVEKKGACLSLFNLIKGWGATLLFMIEEDFPDDSYFKKSDFGADSIIIFQLKKEGGLRKRFLEILKMRGTNHSLKTHQFHIKNKGIIIGN